MINLKKDPDLEENLVKSEENLVKSNVVNLGVNIVIKDLNELLRKIQNISSELKINIIWSTNIRHLFSGLSSESILSYLNKKKLMLETKQIKNTKYEDFVFKEWLNEDLSRQKIISISLEKTSFNKSKNHLKSFLTSDQLEQVKFILKNKIKENNFFEI